MVPVLACICFAFISVTSGADNVAPHEIDCTGAPDGLFEIGCWGYANCKNEVPDIHSCPTGTVLERHNMKCITPGTGQTDCFAPVTCVGKSDASYPDYGDKCVTYYRCQGGLLLGRFYCPTPTAFNEDLGICDYPFNLRAPCGPLPALKTTSSATTASTTTPTTATTTTTTTTTTTAATTQQTGMVTVQVSMMPSSTQSSMDASESTKGSVGVGPIVG